jgi:hypothetical protein
MRKLLAALAALALIGGGTAQTSPDRSAASDSPKEVCVACLSVRVGLPQVVRGPTPYEGDAKFSVVQLSAGHFRGFTANARSYAIDGPAVSAMGGPAVMVLPRGKPGTYDACGQWLQNVQRAGDTLVAWVHNETDCKYAIGQSHKSMSFAVSRDGGMTWEDRGVIITGNDSPASGKITGEGDCGAVDGRDGYYYAYCGRTRDHAVFVARAPVADPGPGRWDKYFEGAWSEPGLGGEATNLGSKLNKGAARWKTNGSTILVGSNPDGPTIFFSSDHVRFTALAEPLLDTDRENWKRPNPTELIAYADLLDASDGSNQLGDSWYLVHTYLQPGETFKERYIVFRPVDVSILPSPISPQVGVLLARWYDPALHDRWTTTAPVPGNGVTYRLDAKLGYVMTISDPAKPAVALEDCVRTDGRHPDHLLTVAGLCETQGYERLRPAGWVYQQPEPATQALYQCYGAQERTHFAAIHPDCDGHGAMERLLGYDLKS